MQKLSACSFYLSLFLMKFFSCTSYQGISAEKEKPRISRDYVKYAELSREAATVFEEGNYELALGKYRAAFNYWSPDGNDLLNSAVCASRMGEINLTKNFLEKSVTEAGLKQSNLVAFSEVLELQEGEIWEQFVADYPKLRQQYFSNKQNLEAYLEIQRMIERDMLVRRLHGKKYLSASEDVAWKGIKEVDSVNVAKLMEITQEYGWQTDAFLILWHQRGTYEEDNDVWNYFTPLINEAINKGEEKPSFWALFIDNKSVHENDGTQVYGTLIDIKIENGKQLFYIKKIADPTTVDQERAKIGMSSLQAYCDRMNIACPENYLDYLSRKQ